MPEHFKDVHFTDKGFSHTLGMDVETNKNTSYRTANISKMSEWLEEEDFGDEDLATLGL